MDSKKKLLLILLLLLVTSVQAVSKKNMLRNVCKEELNLSEILKFIHSSFFHTFVTNE